MPAVYHITHIDNFARICARKRIFCKNRNSEPYVNIAHVNIQDRRSTRPVPCGPGGVLHDYVPFYFAPRSPMLYSVNRGNVAGYDGGQRDIIYLASSIESIQRTGARVVFTDGHAIMNTSIFYDDPENLNQID